MLNRDRTRTMSGLLTRAYDAAKNSPTVARDFVTVIAAFLSQGDLLRWSKGITEGAATVYDRALDANYLNTLVGGAEHRLFDGGHSLAESWRLAAEARPDDTQLQEIAGWMSALWKDGTTVQGLPFATVPKENFDALVDHVTVIMPGVSRDSLYKALSYDAFQVLAAGLGAVGVVFALNSEDQERLAEILGSTGIISILSVNPLLGLTTIAGAAYAYAIRKRKADKAGLLKGSALATISMALFAILGLPVLVELVIVMAVIALLRKLHDRDSAYTLNRPKLIKLLMDGARRVKALPAGFLRLLRKAYRAAQVLEWWDKIKSAPAWRRPRPA